MQAGRQMQYALAASNIVQNTQHNTAVMDCNRICFPTGIPACARYALCSGVHAMGGMAAQIPIKDNKEANDAAMTKVRRSAGIFFISYPLREHLLLVSIADLRSVLYVFFLSPGRCLATLCFLSARMAICTVIMLPAWWCKLLPTTT
jgi:hypothetical protein